MWILLTAAKNATEHVSFKQYYTFKKLWTFSNHCIPLLANAKSIPKKLKLTNNVL